MSVFFDSVVAMFDPAERTYAQGKVPASPTFPYRVLSVTGDRADSYLLSAQHGTRFYRIAMQVFGRTDAGVNDYDATGVAALLDNAPVVAGYKTTPCADLVTSGLFRDPDDLGVLGITSTLTFSTVKETP